MFKNLPYIINNLIYNLQHSLISGCRKIAKQNMRHSRIKMCNILIRRTMNIFVALNLKMLILYSACFKLIFLKEYLAQSELVFALECVYFNSRYIEYIPLVSCCTHYTWVYLG